MRNLPMVGIYNPEENKAAEQEVRKSIQIKGSGYR